VIGAHNDRNRTALNDKERSLLLALATRNIADGSGCTHDEAANVLARLAAEGKLEITGDAERAQVLANGHLRVDAERDWLSFHAAHPGNEPMADERRGG
jgi:hypothetical protein